MKFLIPIFMAISVSALGHPDCDGVEGAALVVGDVIERKPGPSGCWVRLELTFYRDHGLCPLTSRPSVNQWIEAANQSCDKDMGKVSGLLKGYSNNRWVLEASP